MDNAKISPLVTETTRAFVLTRDSFLAICKDNANLTLHLLRNCIAHNEDIEKDQRKEYSKMIIFDSKPYDEIFFEDQAKGYDEIKIKVCFVQPKLSRESLSLAEGATVPSS